MAGARLTQRHVASKEDAAYHEGKGLLVPLSEVDNPLVCMFRIPLGLRGRVSADRQAVV